MTQKNLAIYSINSFAIIYNRCLTYGDLLRQIDKGTTTNLHVPIGQLPSLIGNERFESSLLNLLLEKTPKPPDPLLRRPNLTNSLEKLIKHRKVVLLTGTIHKGKTTAAQLAVSSLSSGAWWINLTERQRSEVDNLLLALAHRIESGDSPDLVVIDDLDISPPAHRAYRDSLALVLHRAEATGRGVLLTARGTSNNLNFVQDFKNVELLEVPELSADEIEGLCIDHGCPEGIANSWGLLISLWTGGHPKLVQVRLGELEQRSWPKPGGSDLTASSQAVLTVRQMTRQLLYDTVSSPVAEFLYTISECSIPMHRSVAVFLMEAIEELSNAGDILDNLTGKWLEQVEGQWFQTTKLLKGVVTDVWSTRKRKRAHIRLHDAILSKRILSPSEAAGLLFHAYIGGESSRLIRTALKLQALDQDDAQYEVERQLLWLPYVALEAGQIIAGNTRAEVVLRALQFRVTKRLDADCLPLVCSRWADAIERISDPKAKAVNLSIMFLLTGFAESEKIPLKYRLNAIAGIPQIPCELSEVKETFAEGFFETVTEIEGLPTDGTISQAIFLCAIRCVCDLASIEELVQWLSTKATAENRRQFDMMLEWPLVQSLGAFVQGSWASVHEATEDWEPWIRCFDNIIDYAKSHASPQFGREAAKAKAIILTEYMEKSDEAIDVLALAETEFGPSAVLVEQHANVLFHTEKYEAVLKLWRRLVDDSNKKIVLDPFAYRRAGISAVRLERWEEAQHIFRNAADSIHPGSLEFTKFGLLVDSALSASLGGDNTVGAALLAKAVLSLPEEAGVEGDERWEAVLRAAVTTSRTIEKRSWKETEDKPPFEPGYASSPDLAVPKAKKGQRLRYELAQAQILRLAAQLKNIPSRSKQKLDELEKSRYFLVRWFTAEVRLANAYSIGPGDDFIEALVGFESSIADLLDKQKRGISPSEPDDGTMPMNPRPTEWRWFGLLCAGVICSGPEMLDQLDAWHKAGIRMVGSEDALTKTIEQFIRGGSLPRNLLHSATIDTTSSPPIRCGAAIKMLQGHLSADETIQLQGFLTSALLTDDSFTRQELFNRHIARRFSQAWRNQLHNRFQFYTPTTTVPDLLWTLDDVDRGKGTLKSLLLTASHALRQPMGILLDRVL